MQSSVIVSPPRTEQMRAVIHIALYLTRTQAVYIKPAQIFPTYITSHLSALYIFQKSRQPVEIGSVLPTQLLPPSKKSSTSKICFSKYQFNLNTLCFSKCPLFVLFCIASSTFLRRPQAYCHLYSPRYFLSFQGFFQSHSSVMTQCFHHNLTQAIVWIRFSPPELHGNSSSLNITIIRPWL